MKPNNLFFVTNRKISKAEHTKIVRNLQLQAFKLKQAMRRAAREHIHADEKP